MPLTIATQLNVGLSVISIGDVSKDDLGNLANYGASKILNVSIDKLKTFNQKFVEIEGYLTNEFENVALYPYKWSESNKALWLNFCDSIIKNREELSLLNYQKVVVIGRVNILHKGHYSGYIAELDSVFCIKKE